MGLLTNTEVCSTVQERLVMKEMTEDKDGVYVGIEAEGYHQGMLTLFTVGEPPITAILDGMSYIFRQRRNFGLYIGGGSAIHKPLSVGILDYVLRQIEGPLFDRVAIQCTDANLVVDYVKLFHDQASRTPRFRHYEWIVPVIFDTYKMSQKTLDTFKHAAKIFDNKIIQFFGKVYIPNKLVLTAPLLEMHIAANFDAKEGEYQTDRVIYLKDKTCH